MPNWSARYDSVFCDSGHSINFSWDKKLADHLGVDPDDLSFLMSCINSESRSESVEKQLKALILTLKLEYSEKLADKKEKEKRELEHFLQRKKKIQQDVEDSKREYSEAKKNWRDQCWAFLDRIENGEKIKYNHLNEVHRTLKTDGYIDIRFFTKTIKLTKPLQECSNLDVSDSCDLQFMRRSLGSMEELAWRCQRGTLF